ncbi:unnamed protein product [Acanthoscelides obtectus]|uniref:Protein N-terminal asparagine amidohydrolase n=1 Tax=Acanthoscelides obtectus TaxID=200917 RepID=A0A9P0QD23_ACAOB|nr:unnamed protein product [Acanthoscelides obtectus]CAH2017573.1 unnamed protein product [Acanthoscelides obtectus]CAK1672679.1 Protein N-terminal asparagine amidohydrolase [Acanthoscelides obtectus]CAK1687245.1 Protein N-terminal asparagine amidohydrolase [Acanthoscelides obtectus]
MVLFIDNIKQEEERHPTSTKALFNLFPSYKKNGTKFSEMPNILVDNKGSLYVMAREYAVVTPKNHRVIILGSDEATTCIILIVRDCNTGATGLAHLDNVGLIEQHIKEIMNSLQRLSEECSQNKYSIYLVGGYSDPRGLSEEIFVGILETLQKVHQEMHLQLACIGDANTVLKDDKPWPKVYGAAVNIDTGEVFPSTFAEKGPDEILRGVKILVGSSNIMNIYENSSGMVKIGPFFYKMPRGIEHWLEETDEAILRKSSTSPDVEPSCFVPNIKKAIQFMIENPRSIHVFKENKPHYFSRDETSGLWVPANV